MSSKYGHISNKTTTNHRSYPYSYRNDNENDNNTQIHLNVRGAKGTTKNTSPFRYKDVNIMQSSGLDSIENLIQSRRSINPHPYGTVQYRSYESQQIVFLKEKLIQTHNKLLRELETNNKLNQDIKNVEDLFRTSERKCRQLQQRSVTQQNQIDQYKRILQRNQTKTEEKYRSVENRLENQNRKNYQLKQQLQTTKNQYMETMMQKNMLQEANTEFKVELKSLSETVANLELQIKDRDDRILNLNKQLREVNQKWERSQKQANDLRYQIQEINNEINSAKSNQKELNHLFSLQKQKNQNLQHDVADLQGYTHQLEQKILSLEKQLQKSKEQYFWLQQNKETTTKTQTQHISKLASDLQALNVMYKQLQRELDSMKKKPIQDAQKKRRHYEITKQFVNQLQNEQQLYGNSGSRAIGFGNNNRTPVANRNKVSRDASPSGLGLFNNKVNQPESTSIEYFKNRNNSGTNSYANLMGKQSLAVKQERKNSQDKNKKLAQLDAMLFNLNLEHKKIKTEIERIDSNSLKTRQMIVKRKKLEEQLNYQEQKIKKVKQDLRKLRVL